MTIVVIVSWIILCVVVGAVAQSIGRSFGTYCLISLFISPLIGFIILAIQGRVTEDEILNENNHIFYCPNCSSTYSSAGNKDEYCPKCNELLLETTVLTRDWKEYPQSRKESLKQEFAGGQRLRRNLGVVNPVIMAQNNSADELKKFKELLDSGAITQEEYDIKKKQILGL